MEQSRERRHEQLFAREFVQEPDGGIMEQIRVSECPLLNNGTFFILFTIINEDLHYSAKKTNRRLIVRILFLVLASEAGPIHDPGGHCGER